MVAKIIKKTSIKNVLAQALKPNRFAVMAKKVSKRFTDDKGNHSKDENMQWLQTNAREFSELAMNLDTKLWAESEIVAEKINKNAEKILNNLEHKLGGGGAFPFLYFLTRYAKPSCIFETGVAAGFSSAAFLTGIKDNNAGKLYSSDFPYFRIPNPEKYIGIIVEESLKENWHLHIEGDEANIPQMAKPFIYIKSSYTPDKSLSNAKLNFCKIFYKLSLKFSHCSCQL